MTLSKRANSEELMDDLTCSGAVVDQTLRELDVINKLLGGNSVTVTGLNRLLKPIKPGTAISLADLGCGSGEMLIRINRWLSGKKIACTLTGVDANPFVISYAKKHCSARKNIDFNVSDILSDQFRSTSYDIVTATLFLHHFTNEQLIEIFSNLKRQARIGIVVNDLHRHWFAYHSIRLLTRWFSRSVMVQHDAPLSVHRGFKKNELRDVLAKAGLDHYSIRWRWAFRWELVICTAPTSSQSL